MTVIVRENQKIHFWVWFKIIFRIIGDNYQTGQWTAWMNDLKEIVT